MANLIKQVVYNIESLSLTAEQLKMLSAEIEDMASEKEEEELEAIMNSWEESPVDEVWRDNFYACIS